MRIHKHKGYIDLTLRRVNIKEKKEKTNAIKLEQKAETIIQLVAKKHKVAPKQLYVKLSGKILENYEYIHHLFEDVIDGAEKLEKYVDSAYIDDITELILQRFKPQIVQLTGTITMQSYAYDGITIIKDAINSIGKVEDVSITYLGGSRYRLIAKGEDYKSVEPIFKDCLNKVVSYMKEHGGEAEYQKQN